MLLQQSQNDLWVSSRKPGLGTHVKVSAEACSGNCRLLSRHTAVYGSTWTRASQFWSQTWVTPEVVHLKTLPKLACSIWPIRVMEKECLRYTCSSFPCGMYDKYRCKSSFWDGGSELQIVIFSPQKYRIDRTHVYLLRQRLCHVQMWLMLFWRDTDQAVGFRWAACRCRCWIPIVAAQARVQHV